MHLLFGIVVIIATKNSLKSEPLVLFDSPSSYCAKQDGKKWYEQINVKVAISVVRNISERICTKMEYISKEF